MRRRIVKVEIYPPERRTLTFYDPAVIPDPKDWLGLDDHDRMRVVRTYHQSARINVRNIKAHSALHTIIENQVATGFGPTKRALLRLQTQGLSRHEAIHAVGSVLATQSRQAMTSASNEENGIVQARINAAIESITAKDWMTPSV